jgi:hypothetical protein
LWKMPRVSEELSTRLALTMPHHERLRDAADLLLSTEPAGGASQMWLL